MGQTSSGSQIENTSSFTLDEIQRLHKRFTKLDTNKNGLIDKEEFLAIPGMKNNPLATRVMDVFDSDGTGDVDFKEFLEGLSKFSARGNKEEKLRFAFSIYDIDRDGFISNGELFIVLKIMVGTNLNDNSIQQLVDRTIVEMDKDKDGKISFEEFKNSLEGTEFLKQMNLAF
jgi:serine/threonine-protein phosphatase 2B regulatory subunit